MRIAALAVLMIGGAALAVALARSIHGSPAPPMPVIVFRAEPTVREPPRTSAEDDRALALAIASVSPAERQRILELVDYTTARLETRLSPLGTDLGDEDEDPIAQLKRDTSRYTPALTAARALDHGAWQATDLHVRIAAFCTDLRAGERCAPAYPAPARPVDPLERRARFLAWSATSSAVLAFGTEEARDAAATRLRERVAKPETTIALVLGNAALAFVPVPEQATLRDAARKLGRAMAANKLKDHSNLESLGRAPPSGRSAPWLALPPNALFVVPRLSAALNHDALEREIAATLEGAPFSWLVAPGR